MSRIELDDLSSAAELIILQASSVSSCKLPYHVEELLKREENRSVGNNLETHKDGGVLKETCWSRICAVVHITAVMDSGILIRARKAILIEVVNLHFDCTVSFCLLGRGSHD